MRGVAYCSVVKVEMPMANLSWIFIKGMTSFEFDAENPNAELEFTFYRKLV
jgi:hypothetical protein